MTKKKTKNTQLAKINKIRNELSKEIEKDYEEKLKEVVKKKMVQIRKTERILELKKQELDEILSGKKKLTEDSLLFEDYKWSD